MKYSNEISRSINPRDLFPRPLRQLTAMFGKQSTHLTYVFKMIYLVNENVGKHWKGHGASPSAKLTAAARSGQFFFYSVRHYGRLIFAIGIDGSG